MRAVCPAEAQGLRISTSASVSPLLGLLERENAAILTSALQPLASQLVPACQEALRKLGIQAPLLFTANDGTVMSAAATMQVGGRAIGAKRGASFHVASKALLEGPSLFSTILPVPQPPPAILQTPISTFCSGPVNSLRGAALLSHVSDAIVLDIGGTTTDCGVLVGSLEGFIRFAPDAFPHLAAHTWLPSCLEHPIGSLMRTHLCDSLCS